MQNSLEKTRPEERCVNREASSLRQSEEMLRQLVENVSDAFWITTIDLARVLYVSPAYETIWGRSCESLRQSPSSWMEAIHPDDRAAAEESFRKVVNGGLRADGCFELRINHPNGSVNWIRLRAFPIRNEKSETVRIAAVAENITEAKALEIELRASEERTRLISDLTADYAYVTRIEPDGTAVVESMTEGFTRVTGYTVEALNQAGGWPALFTVEDLRRAEEVFQLAGNERGVHESQIITKSGEPRWVRYSWQPLSSTPGGPIDRIVGAVQDISERKRAEQRLRELSRSLLDVQETERRHLARELHDELAQHLTALNLNLSVALNPNPEEARRGVEQAQLLLKEMAGRMRTLSQQLRPTMLDDLGLVPAALWLFDSYAVRNRLHVRFEHHGMSRRLGAAIEVAAFRIMQEALTNVARHAEVDDVTVRAWIAAERLHLTIEDRGRGFDVDATLRHRSSAGLSGMQERADLLGGELSIESIERRGTRIAAVIPLDNASLESSHVTAIGARR